MSAKRAISAGGQGRNTLTGQGSLQRAGRLGRGLLYFFPIIDTSHVTLKIGFTPDRADQGGISLCVRGQVACLTAPSFTPDRSFPPPSPNHLPPRSASLPFPAVDQPPAIAADHQSSNPTRYGRPRGGMLEGQSSSTTFPRPVNDGSFTGEDRSAYRQAPTISEPLSAKVRAPRWQPFERGARRPLKPQAFGGNLCSALEAEHAGALPERRKDDRFCEAKGATVAGCSGCGVQWLRPRRICAPPAQNLRPLSTTKAQA